MSKSFRKGEESDAAVSVWLESTEDFGQKVDLTVRIREILRNYPEGLSILKELIQNADDAGARTIRFCSVEGEEEGQRDLKSSSNLSEYMSCSASLLANNDAIFTDTDFESIQRIGDSLKKSTGNKTGRFGVGVNAVYHLTDVPMFVSGNKVVLFDPQCRLIPGLNPANPGKLIKVDSGSGRKVLEALPEVFEPLKAFGCNLKQSFNGTTFRFSLRTEEQAKKSKLSSQWYSLSTLQSLLSDLSSEASSMLLFLKNIEVIEVYHWARGSTEPSLLTRTAVKTSARLRQKRAYMLLVSSVPSRPVNVDYILETACKTPSSSTTCKYIVCNQYGGGNASTMATSKELCHMNLVPWAGVAAKLSEPLEGQVYCFLPLPVHTNLPIHVNGFFELSSNRRDIWWGEDMAGDGRARAQWNQSLLKHVAAPCYARLIQSSIQNQLISTSEYESLFPIHPDIGGPWSALQQALFTIVSNAPILYSTNQSWITPNQSWLLPDHASDKLTQILQKEGVPLVLFQNTKLKDWIQKSCEPILTTPSFLRKYYKTSPSKVLVTKDKLDYGLFLLEYFLQDLQPQNYSELQQCPLLPLANGDLTMFRQLSAVNSSHVEQLMSMGFTKLNTLHALRLCDNNLDTAMEWLMQHTHFDYQPKLDPCLLLQGDNDDGTYKDLIRNHKASNFLIATEHVTSNPNLRKFFYSSEVQRLLNILVITDVSDIMAIFLSKEWINVPHVKVDKVDIVWFQKFWKFLLAQMASSSSTSFAKIAEVYCIVPTKQNYICPLSATASILDGKGLSEDIKPICIKLGCRILHPELWNEIPKELKMYIHQANKNGVVRAIETASRRSGDLFSLLEKEEKMKLLDYFLHGSNDDETKLSKDSVEAIKSFPIFPYFFTPHEIEYAALKDSKMKTKWFILSNFVEGDTCMMTSDFLSCQKLDEKKLLSLFGVCIKLVSRSEFIRHFILPRLNSFSEHDLLYTMKNILVQLPSLLDEDKELEIILKKTSFIPCAGDNSVLKAPQDLFDPSITLLTSLMNIDSFPHESICQQPNLLLSLRNLGLQDTLSWDNLLGCARSIEQQCLFDKQPDAAKQRASMLLSYFDTYALKLFPDLFPGYNNKNKSFFQKLYKNVTEDQEKIGKEKKERAKCIQKILRIQWVPVCTQILLEGSDALKLIIPQQKEKHEGISVAAPLDCCTKDRIWFLSYKKRIVEGEVHTPELRKLFTWDDPLSFEDVAVQLQMLSESFRQFRDNHSEDHTMIQEACQALSAEIPRFYSVLNQVSTTYEQDALKNTLHTTAWLWIGNDFISSNDVAFSSPYSITPYLYTVPVDLRCYKKILSVLGVRESFGPSDFCHVLHRMSCSKTKLSSNEVELAINLVQSLSDYSRLLPDLEVYAPSDNGFVFLAMKMVYDDAPWLTKNIQQDVIFVHPKVSMAVAKKIGCKSLRSMLFEKNTDMLPFGENDSGIVGEAFGQSESLTRRLRNIVEMYPEGPQQLSELIQNADDAGASIVKFLITTKRHNTNSLLSKSLEEWQGPSLIVYNNSKFSSSDFYNLSRIGQASKLDRLNTTGRFGLGFNSVFHWTDVPSIVSGDHLVMLDPHEKYVPGATTAARGIKISFRDSNLVNQFPDQMSPYLVFGCNMKDHFDGTLFRFPFRNEKTASASEISKTCWDERSIENLLSSFQNVLHKYLLFVRNVKRIEVYGQGDRDDTPNLFYYAEVKERSGMANKQQRPISSMSNDWNSISNFITGGENRSLSKEGFFSLLQRTPPSRLPRTQHLVKIKSEQVYHNWKTIFDRKNNDDSFNDNALKISKENYQTVDEYLICTALGGGNCQKMTLQYKEMKLLPWGGVAAHIRQNGEFVRTVKSGNTFCFLPLPCETGLPIHINGYFELSANRRDIWYGDDMTGDGQIRSQWNCLLLSDVIAPLYARLLLLASQTLGQVEIYYPLFPTNNCEIAGGEVWKLVKRALYQELSGNSWKVFYSPLYDGTWVSLREALVMTVENDEQKKLIENSKGTTSSSLIPILLQENMKVVPLPHSILQTIKEYANNIQEVSPSYVRDWFRHKEEQRDNVIMLLKYCLQDLNSETFHELFGLKWIPLINGDYGTFASVCTSSTFFVCNKLEKDLLSQSWNRLVNVWTEDEVINDFLKHLTNSSSSEQQLNIKELEIQDFVKLLSPSFPPEWQDFIEVRWTSAPLDDDSILLRPRSELWLKNLWQYIIRPSTAEEDTQDNILPFVNTWPILPTTVTNQNEKTLCKLLPNRMSMSIVSPIRDSSASIISENVMNVLQDIGIRILDINSFFPSNQHAIVLSLITQGFVQPPTTKGILQAMNNLYGEEEEEELRQRMGKRFRCVTKEGKECFFSFFSDFANWKEHENQQLLEEAQVKLLRSLPIFPIFTSSSTFEFSSITDEMYLPPTSADVKFLNEKFFKASSQEIQLLDILDVKTLNNLEFYLLHICPQLRNFSSEEVELSIGEFLEEFPKYLQKVEHEEKETWITKFSNMHFILNQKGDLVRPIDLYDPGALSLSIQELLDDAMLPRKQLCIRHPNTLPTLRLLGIKSKLSSLGILEAAKRIESQALDQGRQARKRGMALLNFLDSEDMLHEIFREARAKGFTTDQEQVPVSIHNSMELTVENQDGDDDEAEIEVVADEFFKQLSNIAWLPVEPQKEDEGEALRPPMKIGSSFKVLLAAPKTARPKIDEWLCSASMDIVSSNIRSDLLTICFGWNQPLPVKVLCVQLLYLSKAYSEPHPNRSLYQQQLASIIPRIYASLDIQIKSNTECQQIVSSILFNQTQPWIWVGDTFLPSKQIAFEATDNARPYLVRVPPDLLCFQELLRCCGVREQFHAKDFVKLTMDLSVELKGSRANPKQLDLAIGMAKLISRLPTEELEKINKNDIYLPSTEDKLCTARSMVFNDAPWLPDVKSVRHRYNYVHADVGNETARILGSRSLRDVLAAKQNGMISIPCPKSDALIPFFSQRNTNSIAMEDAQMLFSIIEIAEMLNVKHVSILFDYRSHNTESLLHPLLAQAQGPAIVVCFHGVVMTVEEILRFMTPSKYYQERIEGCSGSGGNGFPRFGCGLIASFFFANCLQILSGNQLIFFDPTGEHFFDGSLPSSMSTPNNLDHSFESDVASSTNTPSTKPHIKKKAVARNYGLSIEMLHQFPDQLEPFSSLPFGVREALYPSFTGNKKANFHGSLFRLPLRSHENGLPHSFCKKTFNEESMIALSHQLKKKIPTCFLFTQCLQTVIVHEWSSSEEEKDDDDRSKSRSLRQILSSRVSSSPFARREYRDAINNNNMWKKSGSTSKFSLFKGSGWDPVVSSHIMKINNLFDDDKEEIIDTWLIQSILAPLKLRDMACTDVLKSSQLLPLVSLAARIHQEDNNSTSTRPPVDFTSLEEGTLFTGLDTGISTGLPFFINAPLFLHEFKGTLLLKSNDDADMRSQFPLTRTVKVKQQNGQIVESFVSLNVWNTQSLICVMQQYIPGFLQLIRDHIQHSFEDDLRLFYKFWPFFSRMKTFLQELSRPKTPKGDNLYEDLTKPRVSLYLTHRDGFKSIQDGCFECTQYSTSDTTAKYFKEMMSIFTVPLMVVEDLTRFGVKMKQLTPSFARHILKVQGSHHASYLRHKPKEALELLEFCLADILCNAEAIDEKGKKICSSELHGLCLIPLADGTVGTIGRAMIIATSDQQMLLPCLKETFVSSSAVKKLKSYSIDMLKAIRLTVFSPKILADHIAKVLPSAWKGKSFVSWDFTEKSQQEGDQNQHSIQITRLWLSLFWKEVKLWDYDTVNLFRNWPLIPMKSGELASCSNARFILYFCPSDSSNEELRNSLLEEYRFFQEDCEGSEQRYSIVGTPEARNIGCSTAARDTGGDEAFRNMGRIQEVSNSNIDDSQTLQTLISDQVDITEEDSSNDSVTTQEIGTNVDASSASDDVDSTVVVETTPPPQIDPSLTSSEVKTLHKFLMLIRCPLLETSFFDVEDRLSLLLPTDRLSAVRSILVTLNQCVSYWTNLSAPLRNNNSSTEEPRLIWSALESQELDELLLFLVKHQGARLSLMPSDLAMLRTLPLFESISHDRVAIPNAHDHFLLEESVDVNQIYRYLPDSVRPKILIRKPEIQDIFEDLDVTSLTEADVLQKFALPVFSRLPIQQKEAVCQTILLNWNVIRDNPSFIDTLRETPFVKHYVVDNADDGLRSDVIEFVKANELLDPNNEFLHVMLNQTSSSLFPAEEFCRPEWLELLSEVGLKNRVDCDIFLKCAKKVEEGNDINLSLKLFSYFTDNVSEFMAREFHRKLADIKCVPAESHGASEMRLLKFRDVAVSKDRDLVFKVLPVVPDFITPPQVLFSNLGIVSPPHLASVLSHLRALTEEGDQLDRWSYKYGNIEQVFSKIFSFLQENYSGLSPRVCDGLSNRAIVPVGTTLVKGNRLFFRLNKNLAPLFFEVPRAFGAYDTFLHNIGVKDSPTQEDYSLLLYELKCELGGSKLNVNELSSVVDILNLIADSNHLSSAMASTTLHRSLYAPNIYGALIKLDALAQNDCPRLVDTNRLDLEVCHLVHPKISEVVCKTLGVGLLSDKISENLDDVFEVQYINDRSITALEHNLQSKEFIFTISQLIKNESSLNLDANILQSFQVLAVKCLRIRFFMTKPGDTHRRIDVTKDTEGSLYYVDESNKRLLIAILDFPVGVTLTLTVASFLCDYFSLHRGNVAGLSAMLSSDVANFKSIRKVLGVGVSRSYDELRRGEAGTTLLPTDLDFIELKPLKVFNKNEVVALKESDGSSNLLYGVIMEGGGGSSLSRLKVLVGKGKEITRLSTEIYSFRGGDKSTNIQNRPRKAKVEPQNLSSIAIEQSLSTSDDMESALISQVTPTTLDHLDNSTPPVDRDDLLNAVQDLLKSIDMSLNDDYEDVLKKNLVIRDELNHKDQYVKALETKMETIEKDIVNAMDAFLCPITREVMSDPVICADGHTYERNAIEHWLRSNSRSPQTNTNLTSRVLIPNHAMRNAIESMRHQAGGGLFMNT